MSVPAPISPTRICSPCVEAGAARTTAAGLGILRDIEPAASFPGFEAPNAV